jgi:hypothetical protein
MADNRKLMEAAQRLAPKTLEPVKTPRDFGGTCQFGYRRVEGKFVEDEGKQAAIAEMRALKATNISLRAIAAAMVAKGHKISHEGVARVLRAKTRN